VPTALQPKDGVRLKPDPTPGTAGRRPRVLLVGRARLRFPLDKGLERRFEALSEELEWRQLGTAVDEKRSPDARFALARPFPVRLLDGPLWYLRLPGRIARELRRFRPDAVIAQGAQETALALLARRLARSRAAVVLDLHGDWHAPTRLYGSNARRLLDPFSDALARRALRGADGVRTISEYTTGLVRAAGIEPDAEFPAFMDLSPFTAAPTAPLPERPRALFVGVLERYKAFDVLAEAWRRVSSEVPDAVLHVVGKGTLAPLAAALAEEELARVEWTPALSAEEVSAALDSSTLLVLPSRSEGMGRVVIEAGCRARAVVGSRVGGIPDVVADGETGVLVPPGDADALADALVRVLSDPELAARLGAEGRRRVEPWLVTPEEYARRVRALVDAVVTTR
jgi:glycosyltransferase involved in cell wall biosynthesis